MNGEVFEDAPTSQRVIEAVAETTGNEPTDIEPLYHVVDPDALDRLFAETESTGRSGGYVEFTFAGCDVEVRGAGEIEVTERSVEVEAGTARVASAQTNREGVR